MSLGGHPRVIDNGTIRKLGYGCLLPFHNSMAVSLAVLTQYSNVTNTQPAGHRTTATAALCSFARLQSRGKNRTVALFARWQHLQCAQTSVSQILLQQLRQRGFISIAPISWLTSKTLRYVSHSFTCKQHHNCLYLVSVRQTAPPSIVVANI